MKNKGLTTNQLRTIKHLLECFSIEEAARKAKVSRSTVYLWMKQDGFKKRLHDERNALFYDSLALLKQATGKAVRVLLSLLDSTDEKTKRLSAREIIVHAIKTTEIGDLEERISNIEQLFEEEIDNQQKTR